MTADAQRSRRPFSVSLIEISLLESNGRSGNARRAWLGLPLVRGARAIVVARRCDDSREHYRRFQQEDIDALSDLEHSVRQAAKVIQRSSRLRFFTRSIRKSVKTRIFAGW